MDNRERSLTLARIADLLGGLVLGEASRLVERVAPLEEAGPRELSLLAHPRYRAEARRSAAGALLVRSGLELEGRDQVVVEDPHLGLTVILPILHPLPAPEPGISSSAHVAETARVGEGASVGAFSVLEPGSAIGAGAVVGAGCHVGRGAEVGEGSILHPRVTLYHGCRLGRRVVVHSGAVIGSDGFGYAAKDGIHRKIPQVGSVVIEDDVEIGAGVTIDRGSIGTTVIGRGTKIDNLVQIGHNVRIGANCLIVAQVGISGSTRIGDGTIFAGQSGAAGHLSVGSRVVVASKSAVYGDLPDGAFVAGIPAVDHRRWKKAQAIAARLPELRTEVRALRRLIETLEARNSKKAPPRNARAPSKDERKASRKRPNRTPPRNARAPSKSERKAPGKRANRTPPVGAKGARRRTRVRRGNEK